MNTVTLEYSNGDAVFIVVSDDLTKIDDQVTKFKDVVRTGGVIWGEDSRGNYIVVNGAHVRAIRVTEDLRKAVKEALDNEAETE